MNPRSPLILLVPLFAVGCASQPYPELPDDIAAETVTGSPAIADAASLEANATASAANVSDVAQREAQLAPVSQEVVPPPPDPSTLPAADSRRLDIKIGDRRFENFEDDRMVWSGKLSAGAPEHPTPSGEFRITAKDIDKRSGSYTNYFDWPTPMPYALQFKGPYWIHEGYVPNEHASHGCVRLRHDDAKFVYSRMRVGDKVTVLQ
jgi:lipoprotein-anchoring transpeptidase ErfK/SrfK